MSESDYCSCSDCIEQPSPYRSKVNKIKKYNSKSIGYIISTLEDLLSKVESIDKRVSEIEKNQKNSKKTKSLNLN